MELSQKQIWDINSGFFGVPVNKLMENAGKQVALKIMDMKEPFLILVGPGNNGGDALVCARYLHTMGKDVRVLLTRDPKHIKSILWLDNYSMLMHDFPPEDVIKELPEKCNTFTVIDGLFGIGFEGSWKAPFSDIKKTLEQQKVTCIVIDVPSGFPDDPLQSSGVIALESADESLERYCADSNIPLDVVPIGIPELAKKAVGPAQMLMYLPQRNQSSHKGDNGHLTIIGGSADFFGAPVIAALGAIRSGVDLIEVFVSTRYLRLAEKVLPELILKTYASSDTISTADIDELYAAMNRSSAMLIGPGLVAASAQEMKTIVNALLKHAKEEGIPVLIDAGALLPFSDYAALPDCVFTPHHGEWKRMIQGEARDDISMIAQKYKATIVLKGATDTIASSTGDTIENHTGNAVLTKGGTGDMLSGLIAGFMAQGVPGYRAGQLGTFLLGRAGDEIAKVVASSFTIDELSVTLSHVIKTYV